MNNAAEPPTDPLGEAAEAGYWACFFDQGRGTFTPWDKKGGMKIRVESQDKQLLKQLQRAWGGTISRTPTCAGAERWPKPGCAPIRPSDSQRSDRTCWRRPDYLSSPSDRLNSPTAVPRGTRPRPVTLSIWCMEP